MKRRKEDSAHTKNWNRQKQTRVKDPKLPNEESGEEAPIAKIRLEVYIQVDRRTDKNGICKIRCARACVYVNSSSVLSLV